ncbi:TOMM precursor leader peptide-binding protein [Mycobacterium aquaticum]|uniref:Cyclodehydratase n=1 Tax=Mycobacterium aquaticum TaxID=1927124 RepID=A0A1X0APH3_9MYCO|nr:TOMM precursor leader peptide-binding protein [Mycobacterium aquaticum]ORA31576.1 cyclodehydratase [Mycobacterium aquaticum]
MTTRYVLAPGRPVLLRPDGAVQVGWDPRRAVLVHPPGSITQAQLADLLHTLQGGASRDELTTAAREFDAAEAVDELIAALTDAGIVTVATSHPSRTPSVRIHGRGPLSELLTSALRCSGALVRHTSRPHASAVPDATDLVVLADYQVTEPRVLRELHEAAVAHLPVRLRDGAGLVGPLVIPGLTSCLQCADLHRRDRDAAWPALAAQLRGTVGTAGRATILATAALALRQIDLVIQAVREAGDPRRAPEPPPTLDTTLELDADGYSISARRWSRHPECPC